MKYNPNIVYVSVYPGAGGDDAKDWAEMLLKMYAGYADKRGFKHYLVHDNTLEIRGEGIYHLLKYEPGVHRLVRISPFDSKHNRHTSFALVEVLPEVAEIDIAHLKIPADDLKFEFFRSSGPGGQNVNKVETAVRVIHLPTGIAAASQVERSQARNRERALKLLRIKLAKLLEERQESDLARLRVKVTPEWGHEIRSYILHPYKLVNDKRLKVKINKVEEVLAGNLDLILEKSNPAGIKVD